MKYYLHSYEEELFEALKDEKEARAYLNAALMDEDPRVFLLALKDVIQAQGLSMSELAERGDLNRENLYRILSKKGNPKITSIMSVLNAVGMTLAVQPVKRS